MNKKFVILTAATVAGLAGAHAQNFRLDLSMVLRSVSPAGVITDVQTGGSVNATAGTTYRVELRYRITDLTSDTTASRGLSSANIAISRVGGGSWTRAVLNGGQEDQGSQTTPVNNGAQNPDDTGPGSGATGLIGVFRGGLVNDTDGANGGATLGASSFSILPLALSAPGHQSWTGSASTNIGPANTNTNSASWGVFAFNFLYAGGPVTITASAVADAQTGNRFGYFARTATTNNPVPQTSNLAQDGSISFIPAPGAAALLGIGGLIAGRRRRA